MRKREWDKQKIIARIQKFRHAGIPIGKLYSQDRSMSVSARRLFGSWHAALIEAGLEPDHLEWSRRRIVRELRQCHREKEPIGSKLRAAAVRHFGGIQEARAAAKLPLGRPRSPRHNWTRDTVIAEIRRRHETGGELALILTWRECRPLYESGKRLFGDWNKARAAAGFPAEVLPLLSREEVIQRIKDRHASGQSLTNMQTADPVLYRSARKGFGGWRAALRAAGVEVPLPRRWSRGAVVKALQARHEAGLNLHHTWKEDKRLRRAAIRYFGSWDAALIEAGFTPFQRECWTRERVIERLRICAERNEGRSVRDVDSRLANAAGRIFGGIHAALDAAGVERHPRFWTQARVVAAIQDRYITGHPPNKVGLGSVPLATAAKRYFGSWEAAVEAAGLDGKIRAKNRRRKPEDVVAEIKAWHESGRRLGDVRTQYAALYNAATKHFGTWRSAVAACGLPPGRRTWSKQIVIDEILARVRRGESLSSGHPKNRYLSGSARYYFGSWGNAVKAASATNYLTMRKGA